jgi:RimJ/RimL family protein N-acetyltransferase
MKLIYRLAKVGDEKGVAELIKEGIERKNWIYNGGNVAPNKKKILGMRDGYKKSSNNLSVLAFDGKKVVGSVSAFFKKAGRTRHRAEMGWGVHPDYQGQGIATNLVKILLAEVKKRGFKRVEAECAIENKASWKLAKKFGLEIEGKRKCGLITDDGRYIDTYLLGKVLK